MVREIIHIQVGQCGNQLGNAFWDELRKEHNLNKQGNYSGDDKDQNSSNERLDKIGVYFSEPGNNRFVPRSVMVDLEPGIIDIIKNSAMGTMFKQDNFVFGQNGANNNWAKGFYTDGAELVDEITEVIRKEVESCDCPQGFELTHSTGGGTGSGLGTLILMKLRDTFPDRINATFSVIPHPTILQSVVEPYNSMLSLCQVLENADETFAIDNDSLDRIANDVLKMPNVRYADLNNLVAQVMCGITASLRFPGKLNGDLRKMGVNLVPFPRLHFFQIAQAPLLSEDDSKHTRINLQEITDQMWSTRNSLATVKPDDGKYIAAACMYRGNNGSVSTAEVEDLVRNIQAKKHDEFVQWIPNNMQTSVVNVAQNGIEQSGTFVANTTAMKQIFVRCLETFNKIFKRKAFLHWYKAEGMDEIEFQEACTNMKDLCGEYQDKHDAVAEEDGMDEDEEENDAAIDEDEEEEE